MLCSNCGKELDEDASFCTMCGTPVKSPHPSYSVSDNETREESQPLNNVHGEEEGNHLLPRTLDTSSDKVFRSDEPDNCQDNEQTSTKLDDGETSKSASSQTTKTPKLNSSIAIISLAALVVILILVGGALTNWYGLSKPLDFPSSQAERDIDPPSENGVEGTPLPEDTDGPQIEQSDASIPVKASLDEYSWEELSEISQVIASSASQEEAIGCANSYNLCGPNGELAGMPSKVITLSNGSELHVSIIGFNHDQRETGELAGITFLFDEAVALSPWAQSGFNAGGWQASTVRSWLSMTFFDVLPNDLSQAIVAVNKHANNTGGIDSGILDASVVTTTIDKLWLPSYVELAGTDLANRHWPSTIYGGQYAWCDEVISIEGSQYSLFSETGINAFSPNEVLSRRYEESPCRWWLRTSNPHISNDTLLVAADGNLNDDAGPIEAFGVVPGFCI